jgi:hypothetical protein
MPTSYIDFKEDIKNYIYSNFDKNIKILDIGPGQGTYSDLLTDYKNIDCVEVYKPYVQKFNLKQKYKNVYVSNILDFEFDHYDVIIMGDILDHIDVKDSKKLISKLYNKCDEIIVSVPYLADFNHLYDEPNRNELHIQVDLTSIIMYSRFPELKLRWENNRIGVYFKNNNITSPSTNKKAIYVYLDDNKKIKEEFTWLYKTWILTKSYEKWDLVVFHNPNVNDIPNHKNLIKVPKTPRYELEPFWEDYKFIESIDFMIGYKELNSNYDWILKTDCDVFLTKNFKDLETETTLVGMGGYNDRSSEINSNLDRIANDIGLKRCYRLTNIGATTLINWENLILFRTVKNITEYILKNEFKNDDGKFPGFFKGTSSMYAQELVFNKLLRDNFWYSNLDIKSYFTRKIGNNDYHIHTFQVYDDFSKINHFRGKYDKDYYKKFNINTINGYCHYISSLDIDELAKYF